MVQGKRSIVLPPIPWLGLLIGCAVLSTRAFPKTSGWLFILAGIFWVRIPVPVKLGTAAMIPWVSYLVGFLSFGIAMLRQKQPGLAAGDIGASR